jgi:hypothetical protein
MLKFVRNIRVVPAARFEVFREVKIQVEVFWSVTP